MSESINVHINGDKTKFKSKSAIKRLKLFLKKNSNLDEFNLNHKSYFLEGYLGKIKKIENNLYVDVC